MAPPSSGAAGLRDRRSHARLRRDRGQRSGVGWLLQLALLGTVIAGLVAMHQLPTGEACCSTAPMPSASVDAATGHDDSHLTPASRLRMDAASHAGSAQHGLATDVLGMCLAMLVATAGILMISLREASRGRDDDQVPQPVVVLFSAPPRGPPLPRRLARLQVLRL